uniref:Putative secreted protein n=1 Tax=Anopheles marajoara TaxID=58244 RepID=A0A2M4CBI3_9DIPT
MILCIFLILSSSFSSSSCTHLLHAIPDCVRTVRAGESTTITTIIGTIIVIVYKRVFVCFSGLVIAGGPLLWSPQSPESWY